MKKYDYIRNNSIWDDIVCHTVREVISINIDSHGMITCKYVTFEKPKNIYHEEWDSTRQYRRRISLMMKLISFIKMISFKLKAKFNPVNTYRVGDTLIGVDANGFEKSRLPRTLRGEYKKFTVDKICPITGFINDIISPRQVKLIRRKIQNKPKTF